MHTHTDQYPIDQDRFLTLYLSREHTLPQIADILGISIVQLVNYIRSPEIAQLLESVDAITLQRERILTTQAMRHTLQELDSLAPLPQNATPADQERRRKVLDAVRRAAETVVKLTAASDPRPARSPRPLTPVPPNRLAA